MRRRSRRRPRDPNRRAADASVKKGRHPQRSRPEKFETSSVAAKHLRGERLKRTQCREELAEPVSNNRGCNIGLRVSFCNAAADSFAMRCGHETRHKRAIMLQVRNGGSQTQAICFPDAIRRLALRERRASPCWAWERGPESVRPFAQDPSTSPARSGPRHS
jgi:hypothetical protein